MSKLLSGIVIGALGLYAYQRVTRHEPPPNPAPAPVYAENQQPAALPAVEVDRPQFQCDGRTHCSQMTSCAEATFFLRNCPGVEMDGEGDGVPCEKQWCGHH
jgi:hypothetical protein